MPVFILTLHCGQFLPETAPVISLCECMLLSLTHTHSFRPVLLSPSLPHPSGRAFLVVITLEVGRWGGVSGEGCRQAEGRTNNVFVCPHSGTRDRLGWRQRSWSGGGLEKASLPKKRLHTPPLFLQMPRDRKHTQESRHSQEHRRRVLVNMYAQLQTVTLVV